MSQTYASHSPEHGGWNIYPACPPETLRAIMDACIGTTIQVTFQPRPHPKDTPALSPISDKTKG